MFKANSLITCFYPLDPDLKQKVIQKKNRREVEEAKREVEGRREEGILSILVSNR